MRRELVAGVLILVELLVVYLADLGELGAVVRVLDGVICLVHSALSGARGRDRKRRYTCTFLAVRLLV